jgi:hypothetical protein
MRATAIFSISPSPPPSLPPSPSPPPSFQESTEIERQRVYENVLFLFHACVCLHSVQGHVPSVASSRETALLHIRSSILDPCIVLWLNVCRVVPCFSQQETVRLIDCRVNKVMATFTQPPSGWVRQPSVYEGRGIYMSSYMVSFMVPVARLSSVSLLLPLSLSTHFLPTRNTMGFNDRL